jgi:ribosomal-protein-alanine N-acetyltransferase
MEIILETKRLILREILEEDIEGMYDLDSDPLVHRYLGNNPINNREEAKAIIANVRKQYDENGIGRWALIDKLTKEFIGWSGLKYEKQVRQEMHYYDIGYRLRRKFWGKGIATESALAALKYGFEVMNLAEIYGGAHIENIASNKILNNIGLKFIETFDLDGEAHNWYGIDKNAWHF